MNDRAVSPDAELVHRLLQNDVSAFETLYDRHSCLVYAVVFRILRQAGQAEEVMEDVFLQLWRNTVHYDAARGSLVPWLVTLARNRALYTLGLKNEHQRRLENRSEELLSIVTEPPYEKKLDEKGRAELVRSLMGELNPLQKRAIELAYFQGLSHREIAAALKEPLGTVESWVRQALIRLKERLQATT